MFNIFPPPVLSMWLQTVKFIVKKSKCAGLAQEIGFSAPNSCSLPWLVKGTTQFVHLQNCSTSSPPSFLPTSYLLWKFYLKPNIHLTLSYNSFNIGCHLGCHLGFSFNTNLTSSVNAPLVTQVKLVMGK
jgi:hypothetical protein